MFCRGGRMGDDCGFKEFPDEWLTFADGFN